MSEYHNPVLLKDSVDALIINESGIYVDCTFGGGGHSREILSRLDQNSDMKPSLKFRRSQDLLQQPNRLLPLE